ncbi:MAG: hypothetical protein ACOCY6_04430 [Halodesulfurarchaeum sp.]
MTITRRQLLAGLGGATIVFGGTALARRPPTFTQYTYAEPTDDTSDGILRIAWYETRNGTFVENQGGTDDGEEVTLDPDVTPEYLLEATERTDVAGPVLTLSNVLPGDFGTLVVGLEVVEEEAPDPIALWLAGELTESAENGINEPERSAGDTTPDTGELDEAATIEVWSDSSVLGSCDGLRTLEESLRAPIVERDSFSSVFDPAAAIVNEGVRVFDDCLGPGTIRCVALGWALPKNTGDQVQGDSLAFDFHFAAGPCDGDSPFLIGGDT